LVLPQRQQTGVLGSIESPGSTVFANDLAGPLRAALRLISEIRWLRNCAIGQIMEKVGLSPEVSSRSESQAGRKLSRFKYLRPTRSGNWRELFPGRAGEDVAFVFTTQIGINWSMLPIFLTAR
jgi:hypothetical protein